jgi:uncharacterized membrane protein HdeD (DUF308 family)
MSGLRIAALVLIVIGALMLAFPAISYTTREEVVDLGPLEVTSEEEHRVPLPPILGGVAIVVGLGLLFTGRGRTGAT